MSRQQCHFTAGHAELRSATWRLWHLRKERESGLDVDGRTLKIEVNRPARRVVENGRLLRKVGVGRAGHRLEIAVGNHSLTYERGEPVGRRWCHRLTLHEYRPGRNLGCAGRPSPSAQLRVPGAI